MDRWDRKTDFGCNSCMFYVPKEASAAPDTAGLVGRCRRYAPTMKGYPVVFADDWCGEHKRGANPVRDGKAKEPSEQYPLAQVKEEITKLLFCIQAVEHGPCREDMITEKTEMIRELLEKL